MATMNKSKNTKYSAFTLIEILIGTLIFAVVMVITTGVVGQSVGYQSKIRAIKQTSEESRKLADMITRDVREANGEFTIKYTNGVGLQTGEYDSGLAFFSCGQAACSARITEATNITTDDFNSAISLVPIAPNQAGYVNTIVAKSQNKVKVYFFPRSSARAVYYYEYDFSTMVSGKFKESDGTELTLEGVVKKSYDNHAVGLVAGSADTWIHPTTSLEMKTVFLSLQYYAPPKGAAKTKQTYIRFRIISELGLITKNPKEHAVSIITSTVTSRGYDH